MFEKSSALEMFLKVRKINLLSQEAFGPVCKIPENGKASFFHCNLMFHLIIVVLGNFYIQSLFLFFFPLLLMLFIIVANPLIRTFCLGQEGNY